jgi:hypothetical protein
MLGDIETTRWTRNRHHRLSSSVVTDLKYKSLIRWLATGLAPKFRVHHTAAKIVLRSIVVGRRSIALIPLITCLLAALICEVASAAEPRRVLLLHSFGRDFRPWSEYAKTIRAELIRQSPWPLDFVEYSLTTARFDEDLETPFVDYLRSAFSRHPIDLIVSIGAPAADFVQRNRPQLFSTTPMLLTAVEQRRLRFSTLTENDAVVAVSHDLPVIITNILQVLPATKTIAVVNGNSPLEKFWFAEMQNKFKPFESRVNFIWYNTLSFDGILKSASSLPPHSAIFWELLIVDAAGAV